MDNNTSAVTRDNVKVEFVEDLWVQCDAPSCRKWRRLPPGSVVDDHGRWYCRMNPDTRYNACDADEEVYDERNEILLTAAPPETSSKTRQKTKRRKKDETTERIASLKAELLRRSEWCAAQLKRIEEQPETALEWTSAEFRLLKAHVPSLAELLVEMSDLRSALSYCSEVSCTDAIHAVVEVLTFR